MPASTSISHWTYWIGFHVFILLLLVTEYLLSSQARRRREAIDAFPAQQHSKSLDPRTALRSTILYVVAALAFAAFLYISLGRDPAVQYVAGYAIEEALSVDNLFVFLLLFRLFQIEPYHQPRVLFWGVAGAIVMRGIFIAAGIGLLTGFHWISYVFGAILLAAAIRLLFPGDKRGIENDNQGIPRWIAWLSRIHPVSLRQDVFFTTERAADQEKATRMVTMLMLALVAIELTDVVFALDSIPAVLSITRVPFLAYTSNIMAVLGLRALFFLLAHMLERLRFLHFGLAAVLAFAALKMLAAPRIEVGPLTSLAVIVTVLAITVLLSLTGRSTPNSRPKN